MLRTTPAPFHPMIGRRAEDALYYHGARTPDNEQAVLVFALETEMAGKDAAIGKPRLHRESHVDAGLGMPPSRQRGQLRCRAASEDAHGRRRIRAHVEQAAAAKFAVIAEVRDRQRRDDELRGRLGQRPVLRA